MKRSRSVSLSLMGATAVTLSACGEAQEKVSVFDSPAQCIAAGYEQKLCESQQQNALANHFATAPRYGDRSACEADFGTTHCMQVGGQQGVPVQIAELLKQCEAGQISQEACDKLRQVYPASANTGLSSAAFFIPAMAAFMLALPRTGWSGYGSGYHSYYYGRPLYYPRDGYGYYRTADNFQISNRTGTDVTVPKSIVERPANVRTTTVARGGFGGRAVSTSSGGSGRSGFSFGS